MKVTRDKYNQVKAKLKITSAKNTARLCQLSIRTVYAVKASANYKQYKLSQEEYNQLRRARRSSAKAKAVLEAKRYPAEQAFLDDKHEYLMTADGYKRTPVIPKPSVWQKLKTRFGR